MKKTLVALAALAAFGSASAQVTLYGKADLGLGVTTVTSTPSKPTVDQGAEITGSAYEGSRLGVKAAHPLGGGLTALAQYEFGVDVAGYAGALTANRVATLGVTGSFGTINMGLQWTPYDNAWGFDQLEYNGFSAAGKGWYKGVHGDNGNTGNGNAKKSIAYTTPNMSGFDATILYSNPAEDTKTVSAVKYVGLGANYAAGPLSINFGYEQVGSNEQVSVATAAEKTNAYIIGAAYDLGAAKIGVGFQQANVDAAGAAWKDAGYTLSLSVPVSAQTTFALGYATETTTSAGLADGKSTSYGAQVIYNLTKQAAIYGGAVQTKSVDILIPTDGETTSLKYAAGLRYNF